MSENGTAKLLDSVILSDSTLTLTKEKMSKKAKKHFLNFVSSEMMCQSAMSTAFAAFVYAGHATFQFPVTGDVLKMVHIVTGIILGILLTTRIVLGVHLTMTGTSHMYAFTKSCRTLAVLSTSVQETLTVSAGAEIEKKAISKFRIELVRLLNLAFYCYTLMLQGMRLAVPPTPLRAGEAAKTKDEVLTSTDNPTVMVAKAILSLLEQQRVAKRISNEQVSLLMSKVAELLDTYHASLALLLSPAPVSLTSFAYFFTAGWSYYTGAALAVLELSNGDASAFGLGLTLVYTGFLSLFMYGLFEAGNVLEVPLEAVMALIVAEDMSASLSSDLAALVDDSAVPVLVGI
jgi:hypothetical protein